jgi:two-component system sensor histidine kinase VicK
MGDEKKLTTIGGKTFYDYAVNKSGVVFYFRYYKQDWQNMVSQFNNIIFTALLISLFAAFVFGLLISKAVTNPIEDITRKTQDISEGNFGQVVDRKGNDEIGQLASSINYMSKSLRNMLDEIKNEKAKVDTILNSMTDGIIAFDKEGNVIHANPGARTMLNRIRIDGTLSDFIRAYRINATAEEIMGNPEEVNSRKMSLKRGGRIMRLGFAVFRDEKMKTEGCMIILRDVTEQLKMEIMQKEFVANVSHELKTPLTSIKSYAETLMSGKVEDRNVEKQFIEVIESEVDRMTELVKDLLQLSSLDMKRTKMDFRKHSVKELVEKTVEKVGMTAKEKNHTINIDIGYTGKAVLDFEKMQRVLINLVTNAIKYTDRGGVINVSAYKKGANILISIEDNGMGIPARDLPRIFDRFYRVDKGRSRKMGGTGLGLAIAKEIVTAHSGDIRIKSRLEEGTTVTVEFPVNNEWGTGNE